MPKTLEIVQTYVPGALGRLTELHGSYYSDAWGLNEQFEIDVAAEMAEFLGRFDPTKDGLWLVVEDGKVQGSVFIDGESPTRARLRWFILSDACRGQGLGRQLMERALDFCREKGYEEVYLWTFQGLTSARALYDAFGFEVAHEHPDSSWGRLKLHQRLELRLPRKI